MRAFNVRLNGKLIDTVFYTPNVGEKAEDVVEYVRQSLINHDGYDAGITVTKARERKAPSTPVKALAHICEPVQNASYYGLASVPLTCFRCNNLI
jgi:hypothetical protein